MEHLSGSDKAILEDLRRTLITWAIHSKTSTDLFALAEAIKAIDLIENGESPPAGLQIDIAYKPPPQDGRGASCIIANDGLELFTTAYSYMPDVNMYDHATSFSFHLSRKGGFDEDSFSYWHYVATSIPDAEDPSCELHVTRL